MPKALNIQPTDGAVVRAIAQQRAGGQGKPSKLKGLQADSMFVSWKVGQQLDFYDDLCKYNEDVPHIIDAMIGGTVLDTKQKAVMRSAIGAVTRELRKVLKQDPYATKDGAGKLNASVSGDAATSLQVVEKDGKIQQVLYVLTRTH